MNSPAAKFFFWIWLIAAALPTRGDDFAKQFGVVKAQLAAGNLYNCVTEAERLVFFDTAAVYAQQAYLLAAAACRKAGRTDDAIRYYSKASLAQGSDSGAFTAEIGIIAMLAVKKQRDPALRRAALLENDVRFKSRVREVYWYKGWANALSGFWHEAAAAFSAAGLDSSLPAICAAAAERVVDVKTMKLASAFLPGYAQFYTGHYLNGLLSLAYHGLWGYLTISASLAGRTGDAILIADFLWLRFFTGNLQNAEKFCVDYNAGISNEYLIFLQNNYQGLQP